MTDKQKLLDWIYHCSDTATFEDIVISYMRVYNKDFSAMRINEFIMSLSAYQCDKINALERTVKISHENATYLKCYLEGKMYENEEAARECVDIQIENAKAILESTEKVAL